MKWDSIYCEGDFVIKTDQRGIKFLFDQKFIEDTILEYLTGYDYFVEYKREK